MGQKTVFHLVVIAALALAGTGAQLQSEGCVSLNVVTADDSDALNPNSPELCAAYCGSSGYSYLALSRQFCSCWSKQPTNMTKYAEDSCSFNCSQPYSNQACGGIDPATGVSLFNLFLSQGNSSTTAAPIKTPAVASGPVPEASFPPEGLTVTPFMTEPAATPSLSSPSLLPSLLPSSASLPSYANFSSVLSSPSFAPVSSAPSLPTSPTPDAIPFTPASGGATPSDPPANNSTPAGTGITAAPVASSPPPSELDPSAPQPPRLQTEVSRIFVTVTQCGAAAGPALVSPGSPGTAVVARPQNETAGLAAVSTSSKIVAGVTKVPAPAPAASSARPAPAIAGAGRTATGWASGLVLLATVVLML